MIPLDGPGSHKADLAELRLLQAKLDRVTKILQGMGWKPQAVKEALAVIEE